MNIQGSRKSRIKKQSTTALVTKLKRLELLTDNRRPSHSSIAEQLSDRGEQQETASSVQNAYKNISERRFKYCTEESRQTPNRQIVFYDGVVESPFLVTGHCFFFTDT